jgi:hypothetical protein
LTTLAARQDHSEREPTPNYQSFKVQIEDWAPSYSFALHDFKHRQGLYWEHPELTISGIFLAPERVKDREVMLVFLGSRDDRQALEQPPGDLQGRALRARPAPGC